MPATSSEITYARSYIGTTETDDVFNERYDRLGTLNAAIAESLRAQLAVLTLDSPAQVSVGSVSRSNASNLTALREMLNKFEDSTGTGLIGAEFIGAERQRRR